jgi:hypothetical protein
MPKKRGRMMRNSLRGSACIKAEDEASNYIAEYKWNTIDLIPYQKLTQTPERSIKRGATLAMARCARRTKSHQGGP